MTVQLLSGSIYEDILPVRPVTADMHPWVTEISFASTDRHEVIRHGLECFRKAHCRRDNGKLQSNIHFSEIEFGAIHCGLEVFRKVGSLSALTDPKGKMMTITFHCLDGRPTRRFTVQNGDWNKAGAILDEILCQ